MIEEDPPHPVSEVMAMVKSRKGDQVRLNACAASPASAQLGRRGTLSQGMKPRPLATAPNRATPRQTASPCRASLTQRLSA